MDRSDTLRRAMREHYHLKEAVRALNSFLYLGPLRPPLVRLSRLLRRGRVAAPSGDSLLQGLQPAPCAEALREYGYSGTFPVDAGAVEAMRGILSGAQVESIKDPHLTEKSVSRLLEDPRLQLALQDYFGCPPILHSSSLQVVNGAAHVHKEPGAVCTKNFHYDVPDFKGVALFVYLNDVDRDGGHHVLIPGTHLHTSLRKMSNRRLPYAEACARYGEENFVHVTGPSGTAFLEDTVCWHKRALSSRPRYSLMAVFTLQRRPARG